MVRAEQCYRTSAVDPNVRFYPPGATIIDEGTSDDGCIYILTSGTLGVFREGRLLRELSEPGVLFGEMATILKSRRTATIRTMTECKVTVYTGGVKRIVEQFPSITMKLIVALAQRVEDLTNACVEGKFPIEHPPERNAEAGEDHDGTLGVNVHH